MTAVSRITCCSVAAAFAAACILVTLVGTDAGAVSPGYSGRIAFMRGTGSVYTANADGTGAVDVRPAGAMYPSYLADGTLTYMETSTRMVVAVAPNGTKTNLFTRPAGGFSAAASPDGTTFLMMMSEDGARLSTISVIDSDGTDLRQPWAGDAFNESAPAWFPDGQHVVFTRADETYSYTELVTSKIDGTETTVVPLALGEGYASPASPSVSPDGTKLVFTVYNQAAAQVQVATVNVDGSDLHHIVPTHGGNNPTFSPDGTKILFQTFSETVQGLYVMNADGTNQQQITTAGDTYPVWQPLASPPTTTTTSTTSTTSLLPPKAIITVARVKDTRTLIVSGVHTTGAVSYQWNWGDGTAAATTSNASHTYAKGGVYPLKLTAKNAQGTPSVAKIFVRVALATDKVALPNYSTPPPVTNTGPNMNPRAVLTIAWPNTARSVYASAAGSFDPDGTYLQYAWDWSDGPIAWAAPKSVMHQYATAGIKRVRLNVADQWVGTWTEVWVKVA